MEYNVNSDLVGERFIEGVGFELRTLLNGFSGPLQLMKFKIDDPELFEVFRMFDTSLARLQRLAERSSIIAAIDQKTIYEKEQVDIADIAKYTALEMQALADLESISLSIVSGTQNVSVIGNRELLVQVFQVIFELVISLSAHNSTISIEFKNINGIVFCNITSPTANLPHLQGSSKNTYVLEDSLSWDIVLIIKILELHKAKIQTENSNGAGSTLQIIFQT